MNTSRLLSLAACLGFFSISACVLSQSRYYRVGIEGNIPIGKLTEMNDALQIADATQKSDLLQRLGIDRKIVEAALSSPGSEAISIQSVRTSLRKFGLVFLPCGIQNQAFLYVLDSGGPNSWHAGDHIALDCFHQEPTYRVLSITPGEDSILVQHAHGGHGSGMVEDDTSLYTLKAGQFRQLLSTKDFWSQADPMDPASIVEQTSTFLFFPGQTIEETRITALTAYGKKWSDGSGDGRPASSLFSQIHSES